MNIEIDCRACDSPLECLQCVRQCPEAVFGAYPRGRRERGVPPSKWTVLPMFLSRCMACMNCVHLCPARAISVKV